MSDANFERYQRLRKEAIEDLRNTLMAWAAESGPADMTMDQLRELLDVSIRTLNHHGRRIHDNAEAADGGE